MKKNVIKAVNCINLSIKKPVLGMSYFKDNKRGEKQGEKQGNKI